MAVAPIAAAAMAASGVISAIGAIRSGQATAASAKFNQNIADQNAEIARQQGVVDEMNMRRKQVQALGAIKAATGASGVTMEGSPLDILESSTYQAEMDAQRVKYTSQLRSIGYINESNLYGMERSTARTNAALGAASSLLMSGSRASNMNNPMRTDNTEKPVQVAGS